MFLKLFNIVKGMERTFSNENVRLNFKITHTLSYPPYHRKKMKSYTSYFSSELFLAHIKLDLGSIQHPKPIRKGVCGINFLSPNLNPKVLRPTRKKTLGRW